MFTLKTHGDVKRMLNNYQEALQNLNKANVLEPNIAFTLKTHRIVKMMLKDY